MSDEFVIYMVISILCLLMGLVTGFKVGYAYAMRVSQGFNLTEWLKSLLPLGKFQ